MSYCIWGSQKWRPLYLLGQGPVLDVGKSTIIIGGGLVGCETALWLKESKGIEVTIVELQSDILQVGGSLCSANKDMLKNLIVFHQIPIFTRSRVAGRNAE